MSLTESSPNVLAIKIHKNTEKNFIVFCVAFLLSSFHSVPLQGCFVSFFFSNRHQQKQDPWLKVNNLHKRLHLVLSLSPTEEARPRS
jgi:hypothetical protein